MLSATELASMRAMNTEIMNDRASIARFTRVQEGFDYTDTWADVQTNVPCRVFEPSGVRSFEGAVGERQASAGYPIVHLPYGTNVNEQDRIKIGTRVLEVVREVVNTYGFTVTLLCSEVRSNDV